MPRETNAAKRERAIEVCERLNRRYGPVECFLDHENPFRLLIAVLLSAQTTALPQPLRNAGGRDALGPVHR